jgi:hypothetical protein
MNWKDQYRAALIEVDPAKLLGLIHKTEEAMGVRSEALPAVTTQELQEMGDATRTLRILKRETQTGEAQTGEAQTGDVWRSI